MKKIKLRMMFVAFALLAVTVPVSFSVVACKDKSAELTDKEQALKALRDLPRDEDWTIQRLVEWSDLWVAYFDALKYEIAFSTFKFTKKELASNQLLQAAIVRIINQVISSDLQKWNIPKEYDSDSVNTTYSLFRVDEQEVVTRGRIIINLIAPDPRADGSTYNSSFSVSLRYDIID